MKNVKFISLIGLVIIFLSSCFFAQSSKGLNIITESNRVALVIGNSTYTNGFTVLNSPANDALKMAEALKRLGFKLVGNKAHVDVKFEQMETLVDQFTQEIKAGGVGFFYFSGHGSQDNQKDNYLIPVDSSIKYQGDLKFKALNVERVISRMEEAENKLNILVLDACRNNRLPSGFKSGNKGLNTSVANIPSGLYIAYAARDGQVAADGEYDGYSLYTRELLKNIETPNTRLEDIFIRTRIAVKRKSNNAQFPIDYGSIDGWFYFKIDANFAENGKRGTGEFGAAGPDDQAQTMANQALMEMIQGNYETARAFSVDALKLDRNQPFALAISGWARSSLKDYVTARGELEKADKLEPRNSFVLAQLMEVYSNLSQKELADKMASKVLELTPKPKTAVEYFARAQANTYLEKTDLAIADFTKAIELEVKFAEAYDRRGTLYEETKKGNLAIADFSAAIFINPRFGVAYYDRGNSYFTKEEYDSAIADFSKAIALNPQCHPCTFNNRGLAYHYSQKFDLAVTDYNRAIELDPKFQPAHGNRGMARISLKQYDAAIEDYTKAIELDPADAGAYNGRGAAYFNKEQYEKAVADFTKAIERDGDEPNAYNNRANAYEKLGNVDLANADRYKFRELIKRR